MNSIEYIRVDADILKQEGRMGISLPMRIIKYETIFYDHKFNVTNYIVSLALHAFSVAAIRILSRQSPKRKRRDRIIKYGTVLWIRRFRRNDKGVRQ